MPNSNCRFYLVSQIFTVYYDDMDLTVFHNFNYDFFKWRIVYLFTHFGCAGCSLWAFSHWDQLRLLSSCSAWACHCRGFSYWGARRIGHMDFSSCVSQALEHKFSSCGTQVYVFCCMWDAPRSGMEPVSPALTGRFFFTTEPPGEP